jgi:rhamnulokinase
MTAPTHRVVAVDLGASSGRVIAATVSPDTLDLAEAHRFANAPVAVGGVLHWDILGIYRELTAGIRAVGAGGRVDAIGIDSWAVDYGLLDASGTLLSNPYCYRDPRTAAATARVLDTVGADHLYSVTGLQQLPFNTIYQLAASLGTPQLDAAETLLLLPDLVGYWLTGEVGAERTNASTTQLYDARARTWAYDLAAAVGIPRRILPPLRDAGDVVGTLRPEVAEHLGLSAGVPVVAVGSHDTASAVAAVPADERPFAYICSGTWSLVGLELDRPVLTPAARAADFANEGGVDGTVRFLKNVMGLWVLSESVRHWEADRTATIGLDRLLAAAAGVPPLRTLVDIDDPRLLPPGDMPRRLADLARETDEPVPHTPAEVTRCVLDSLAVAYRRRVREAAALAGRDVAVVHMVGGGARNSLLCQLTADACGLPVLAGPAEASAIGNILVQARTLGADLPDLAAMRALVRRAHPPRPYRPRDPRPWDAAAVRVGIE